MAARNLTDRTLKSLRPASAGKTYDVWDSSFPGFGVRVSETGRKTFVIAARVGGAGHPTRRAIGAYVDGIFGAKQARTKAREWLDLIEAGRDPAVIEQQARRAALRQQANTFEAVAEAFIRHVKRQGLRTAPRMEHDLHTVFVARWKKVPITDITSSDVRRVIGEAVDRGAPYTAFKHFALVRRLLNWVIGTGDFGLEVNACSRLKTKDLIGERNSRTRVLSDDEVRALWRVTGRWKYPYGPLYRVLLMTGLRLNAACGAQWSEIDFTKREWIIPAERMKKVKNVARAHLVSITDALAEVLQELPRFTEHDFLFTASGKAPLKPAGFSDPKALLDKRMLRTLRAVARLRGDDPKRVVLKSFVNHDVRRTARSHLSALRVPEEVREAVLAHVRPGIKGVYDVYEYRDEKSVALTLWADRIAAIVEGKPAKVVSLRRLKS